jgi:RNA polymerase sigma-70 factor (ECF subfamily)
MDRLHSITLMIDMLRDGSDDQQQQAAGRIWQEYFPRLLALARSRLDPSVRQRVDEEDVVQSMYKSFCIRHQRGDFEFDGRDDLWRLLVQITVQKARNAAKRQQRQRRDVRKEQAFETGDSPSMAQGPAAYLASVEPTPDDAVMLNEQVQGRLEQLPEDQRQIALWKLQGYTNEDISGADKMNCSIRTVERKLNLIRKTWEAAIAGEQEDEPGEQDGA